MKSEQIKDLFDYYLTNMIQFEKARSFFKQAFGLKLPKTLSYSKLINRIPSVSARDFEKLKVFVLEQYQRENCSYHLKNLKSGILKGHSWHNASPSRMHLSMQEIVRKQIEVEGDLDWLLEVGQDIMKQEYFMVATHDLIQDTIISSHKNVLPSLREKSISDFILDDLPYDLKHTGIPEDWRKPVEGNELELAMSLFKKADPQRLSKNARNSLHQWGLNRFYVVVQHQEDWLTNPEFVLDQIRLKLDAVTAPYLFRFDENIKVFLRIISI